uniref:Uncharacterized protein n=1 Tax=Pyxicephalus adspersus TaxID=30357 RepID=A0AAV2ZQ95_PYXAD|nr:TPA: hypothetical protein GDO54_004989 [Pyxicephalus adspersus]
MRVPHHVPEEYGFIFTDRKPLVPSLCFCKWVPGLPFTPIGLHQWPLALVRWAAMWSHLQLCGRPCPSLCLALLLKAPHKYESMVLHSLNERWTKLDILCYRYLLSVQKTNKSHYQKPPES